MPSRRGATVHDSMERVYAEIRAHALTSPEDAAWANAVWQRKRKAPVGVVDIPSKGGKAKGFLSEFEPGSRLHPTRARKSAAKHKKNWENAAKAASNTFTKGVFYSFTIGTSVPLHEDWDVATSKLVFSATLGFLGQRRENLSRLCKRHGVVRLGHSTHVSLKPYPGAGKVEVHGNYVLPVVPAVTAPEIQAWIHCHFLFYAPKPLGPQQFKRLKKSLEAQFGRQCVVSHPNAKEGKLFAQKEPSVTSLIDYFQHYPLSIPPDAAGQPMADLRTFADWHPKILAGYILAADGRRLTELPRSSPSLPKKPSKRRKRSSTQPPPANKVASVLPTDTGLRVIVLNPSSLAAAVDAAKAAAPAPTKAVE